MAKIGDREQKPKASACTLPCQVDRERRAQDCHGRGGVRAVQEVGLVGWVPKGVVGAALVQALTGFQGLRCHEEIRRVGRALAPLRDEPTSLCQSIPKAGVLAADALYGFVAVC